MLSAVAVDANGDGLAKIKNLVVTDHLLLRVLSPHAYS
jgi:hypothetical protein